MDILVDDELRQYFLEMLLSRNIKKTDDNNHSPIRAVGLMGRPLGVYQYDRFSSDSQQLVITNDRSYSSMPYSTYNFNRMQ